MGAGAEGGEADNGPGLNPALLTQFVVQNWQRPRRRVAVRPDVGRDLFRRKAELSPHTFQYAVVGLVGDDQIDIV